MTGWLAIVWLAQLGEFKQSRLTLRVEQLFVLGGHLSLSVLKSFPGLQFQQQNEAEQQGSEKPPASR